MSNKVITKFFISSAIFSLMGISLNAFALPYYLTITNNSKKSPAISFKETSRYCIRTSPRYPTLVYGQTSPKGYIDTKSWVFTSCGYEHSSISYDILNAYTGKKIGTLVWYDPVAKNYYVNVYINGGKQQHFKNDCDQRLGCPISIAISIKDK